MSDKTIEFTERAVKNIQQMGYRLGNIGNMYGDRSEAYAKTAESLSASLIQMINLGGTISAENDLSLIGVSFITYGVIWHPEKKREVCDKCGGHGVIAIGNGGPSDVKICNRCYGTGKMLVNDELLGTWSVHS